MKRVFVVLIVLAITASACGGGEEEPSPTPTATQAPAADEPAAPAEETLPPATTSAPTNTPEPTDAAPTPEPDVGDGKNTDFCGFMSGIDAAQSGLSDGLDADSFRTAMEESVAGLRQARDLAPSEIAGDVQFVLDTFLDLVALFEEYEWNLIAIGTNATDDPRLLAFDNDAFVAAIERIGNFCGLDLNTRDGDDPDAGGDSGLDVPDEIPSALVPPEVTQSFAGGGTFALETNLSFEDTVAFYTGVLGKPFFVDEGEMAALWTTTFEGGQVSVALGSDSGSVNILITLLG